MAAAYRSYLIRTGVLTEIPDLEEDIPLYLETLGTIESTKDIFGIPVETMVPLTTFEDTINIIKDFEKENINNLKIKMNAWMNGGVYGEIATSIEIEEVLGGKEGFLELVKYAKEHKSGSILACLSGRGDKDIDYVYENYGCGEKFNIK